ncbi:MAG TPA: xanthine dehydrogenase family protein molybdopterin-binding subunit [Albitalea sp.]|nr:xanthine dehydrogenase family protein molybdopterin-binding subunit [Albitalea sp.]
MAAIGQALDRTDGTLKTTGEARYAAEFAPPRLVHAVIVQSTIASGAIVAIDAGAAQRMPGVLGVLTHLNAPRLPNGGKAAINPPAGRTLSLLQDAAVHYNGEPVALVVAESLEVAVAAAERVAIRYRNAPAELDFERAKARAHKPKDAGPERAADLAWGDADAALKTAPVRLVQTYTTPMEHHNPMEPHATVAAWEGDRLTLYDSTQYISGVKETVAKTFGIAPDKVRVVSPFVGGGFGCKGSTWSHVVLAAMAARRFARPVKLVLARPQMFGPVGGRPRTEQRITLGANPNGSLIAVRHDVVSHTSFMEDFSEPSAMPTRSLYACPNGATTHRLAQLAVGVPTFQRAPGESTGTFALESAMDELAYQLGIDPLELRLRNYAEVEPSTGKPWSSKMLRQCYAHAAQRFGWARRPMAPRSQRDGRLLVGWGMATATYPAHRWPASASVKLLPDGTALVRSGTQDLGTGTYTVMTQVAADALGIPVEKVRFELGDTLMPPAGVSGGSTTVASVAPAVQAACTQAREKKAAALAAGRGGEVIEAQASAKAGEEKEKFATRSFGAVFAEVRVDEDLGSISVPRIVADYSVGRLMNAKLAHSQLMGGLVWGVGMALLEESRLDIRYGRFVNANLAEYHVPVNADIGTLDIGFCDEDDRNFNPVGARGIGEIGITGISAAIANAVFHATGKRVRKLPIRLDDLI